MRNGKCLVLILCIFLLVIAALLTYSELGTLNPFAAAVGLARVCLFDEPYVQTGFLSKAWLSQPEDGFDLLQSVMADMGYTHLPEEQMGSVFLFENADGKQQQVRYLVNAHFAKWIWY